MKILISAYACRPLWGSECAVGWNMARMLAEHHEVWVITEERFREAIEADLAVSPVPNLHFHYQKIPLDQHWTRRRGIAFHYYLWQLAILPLGRKLHREVGFDLIHHLTYARYWTPSFLATLPVPFVWGPMGGGQSMPPAFRKEFDIHGQIFELTRDAARTIGERDAFVRLTARRSTLALASNDETAVRIRALGGRNVEIQGDICVGREEIESLGRLPAPPDRPIRFVSSGRLLKWKGAYLGLRAFAKAGIEDSEYWIIGRGPERERLIALAKDLGIGEKVHFSSGQLERDEYLRTLAGCHVLVHPTLHEAFGGTILEAMSVGRPVICLDLAGPSKQITPECGFKIPATTPDQSIAEMAAAMIRLAKDPELRASMGRAGHARMLEHFTWESRTEYLCDVYRQIHEASTSPDRTPASSARP